MIELGSDDTYAHARMAAPIINERLKMTHQTHQTHGIRSFPHLVDGFAGAGRMLGRGGA
jgi:hypothetical protein